MLWILVLLLPVAWLVLSANRCGTRYDRRCDDEQQLAFIRRARARAAERRRNFP